MTAAKCRLRRIYPARFCSIASAAVLVLVFFSSPAGAQLTDVKGGSDHPMISRYAGSTIIGHEVKTFDEFLLPLGPAFLEQGRFAVKKSERLEGRVTRVLYVAPPGRSSLEVMRNYEQELKKGGFQTLYSCSSECGPGMTMRMVLYPPERHLNKPSINASMAFALPRDERYLAARRTSADGTVHVSLLVAEQGNAAAQQTFGRTVTLLDVIESAAMETGMVKVDAAAMARELATTGHVALYGILFDTNRADIKPESRPALHEIAKLLKQDSGLRLLVVGHTDNVGGFEANLALSERRAAAVLNELATTHGIAASRLRPVGVGMAAPVAPNDTDAGRARNRRVELVRQ